MRGVRVFIKSVLIFTLILVDMEKELKKGG